MSFHLIMWIHILNKLSDGFVLNYADYAYNVRFDDSDVFKVEPKDESFEMIKPVEAKKFQIEDKESKLYLLHRLASKAYDSGIEKSPTEVVFRELFRNKGIKDIKFEESVTENPTQADIKIQITPYRPKVLNKRQSNRTTTTEEYDYKALLQEYYEQSIQEFNSNDSYNFSNYENDSSLKDMVREAFIFNLNATNCTEEELTGIGLRALYCIVVEWRRGGVPAAVLVLRLWDIAKIWLLVYVAVALPCFCTKGWCCWCLWCKFFNPKRTIREANQYLLMNPPGVLRGKKGKEIFYPPSKCEFVTYTRFQHYLKTI